MKDVLADIDRWREAGEPLALATVVETWGSAPRAVGSRMAVTAGGGIAGSVSGGCVENAVVEAAHATIANGRPQLLRFGVADETAWQVGLACGGKIEVFVERLDRSSYEILRSEILAQRPAAAATVVRGPEALVGRRLLVLADGTVHGGIGEDLDPAAAELARAALSGGAGGRIAAVRDGAVDLFVEVLRPPIRLVIVGGVHIAVSLVALARNLGLRTVVVDPREAFANRRRFPDADRLVTLWPDRALAELPVDSESAVVVLTHDPKLDDPALVAALAGPAFYVGALGSKRTNEKRRARLLAAGVSDAQLARLHAPIGLDLGGRSPEEIALSIAAEIVSVRNKGAPSAAAR